MGYYPVDIDLTTNGGGGGGGGGGGLVEGLPKISWDELAPNKRIGQGTFSAVYSGMWKRGYDGQGMPFGNEVALKIMTRSRSRDREEYLHAKVRGKED